MTSTAAENLTKYLALGDISQAYAIAMHRQPFVLVDPYTVPPYVHFYALARVGRGMRRRASSESPMTRST